MGLVRVVRNEESEPRISQISRMRRGKYPPALCSWVGFHSFAAPLQCALNYLESPSSPGKRFQHRSSADGIDEWVFVMLASVDSGRYGKPINGVKPERTGWIDDG